MKQGVSAGGVIVKEIDNNTHILLIKFDKFGTLAFAKGHIKKDESLEDAAIREVLEETGIKAKSVIKKLGVVKRMSAEKDEMKTIHLFLMETDDFNHSKADEDYGWYMVDDALQKMAFPEEKEFLNKIRDKLI
jgi:diadenosine hexaphosphate hydrolase (ATP-forming)